MRNIFISTLLLFLSCAAVAQQDSTTIASEKVEVVKRYEASILQANRKEINIEKTEVTKAPINYNYNLSGEKIIDFERPDPEIRPIGFQGNTEERKKILNGYVYGGYGAHKTIPVGAAYHYYIEDWIDAGFRVDHFSAESTKELNTINGLISSQYRDLNSNLYLGYHLGEQTKLRLEGDYDVNVRNTFNADTTNINVRKVGGDLAFDHNVFEDNGFAIRLGGGYHAAFHKADDFRDNYFSGSINMIKRLTDKMTAELPASFIRTAVSDSLSVYDSTSFVDLILQPNVRFRGQNFNVKVGLEYITNDESSLLFPIVDISMDRVISILDLRVYTESEYRRNSMYNLIEDVPYLLSRVADYSPSYMRSYNLKPSVNYKNFTFGLNLAYRTYENDYNPVGFNELGRFTVGYLDREEIRVTPSVEWTNNENLNFGLSYDHNLFLSDSVALYYKPTSSLKFNGEQKLLRSKLTFIQDLTLVGNRNHSEFVSNAPIASLYEVQLPVYIDLGAGIKYRINDHVDISARGVNLLQDNERVAFQSEGQEVNYSAQWLSYPIPGRQFWGTVKLRF